MTTPHDAQGVGPGCNDPLGAAAGVRKPMRTQPWWRYVLRSLIDVFAMYCAWAIQFAASGNYAAAFITAVAVGVYGAWCFFDGSA